jgi:hypothetical protein
MMPAWFGHTLHVQSKRQRSIDPATKKEVEKIGRRLYTVRHYDDGSDIAYLAQVRATTSRAPLIKDYYDLDREGKVMVEFLDTLIGKGKG